MGLLRATLARRSQSKPVAEAISAEITKDLAPLRQAELERWFAAS
jgi:hypothetical protein